MVVSQEVTISVPPSAVWAVVSDPTQTSRWSPENTGGRLDAGSALLVGDTFVGSNHRRHYRWVTRCRVTAAEPERRFAFRVEALGVRKPWLRAPIASWAYDLEPVDGGTKVTETWTDDRTGWSDRVTKIFDKVATHSSFHEYNTQNMRTTLDNLKTTLEAEARAKS
jgi:uncharacterized protein YndB with AHSA1/START domain